MLKNKANQTGFTFIDTILAVSVGIAMVLGGFVSHANAVAEEPQTITREQADESNMNAGRFCVVAQTSTGQTAGHAKSCGGDHE